MRAFDILDDRVLKGIQVTGQPPAVVLGRGTDMTVVWLGRQDAPGLVSTRCVEASVVTNVGVMPLYDGGGEPNGHHLLVKPDPRIQDDNRALVCWRFPSGDFGASRIVAPQGVRVVAQGVRRLEGPRFGEVAETMAILQPGQELRAHRNFGEYTHAVLKWDGEELSVLTGGPEVFGVTKTTEKELVAS